MNSIPLTTGFSDERSAECRTAVIGSALRHREAHRFAPACGTGKHIGSLPLARFDAPSIPAGGGAMAGSPLSHVLVEARDTGRVHGGRRGSRCAGRAGRACGKRLGGRPRRERTGGATDCGRCPDRRCRRDGSSRGWREQRRRAAPALRLSAPRDAWLRAPACQLPPLAAFGRVALKVSNLCSSCNRPSFAADSPGNRQLFPELER